MIEAIGWDWIIGVTVFGLVVAGLAFGLDR